MKLATIPATLAAMGHKADPPETPREIPFGLKNFSSLPDEAFVGSDVVRGLYRDITPVTLWRWVKTHRVPAPCKLAGQRFNAWRVGDLRRAMAGEGAQ
ncbi:MAG: transcriptional regulator [Proteobacteria bacterium]|nr:transcriptional regulator [Pseudomonadota bacterium]